MQRPSFLSFLIFLCALSCIATLLFGETPWQELFSSAILRLQGKSADWNSLLDERIPRLIVLLSSGASLATAGLIMQSLFHNPLASPSVLGITSGGSLAAILVFLFDFRYHYPYALPLAAFLGSFLTLCLVYALLLLQRERGFTSLILIGIALSTLLMAIQGALLYSLRDHWQLIQTITEWESGSAIDRNWDHVHMQLPLTLIGLGGAWSYREELNLLSLGDDEAHNLGVDVKKVRWRLLLCTALLTGGTLASIGMIAFFGLLIPHIFRRLQGPNHQALIPSSIVGGAAILALLDFILRFFFLYPLSLGNLSAIIGGFFFLMLLFNPQAQQPSRSYET